MIVYGTSLYVQSWQRYKRFCTHECMAVVAIFTDQSIRGDYNMQSISDLSSLHGPSGVQWHCIRGRNNEKSNVIRPPGHKAQPSYCPVDIFTQNIYMHMDRSEHWGRSPPHFRISFINTSPQLCLRLM